MTPNEAKKLTKSRFLPNLISNITVDLTTQKTLEFLRATAKGETWPPEEASTEEAGKIEESEEIRTEIEGTEETTKERSVDEEISPATMEDPLMIEDDPITPSEEEEVISQEIEEEKEAEAEHSNVKIQKQTTEDELDEAESPQEDQVEDEA